jgi:hypothetical protein
MSRATAGSHGDTQRALRAARQLALCRLAVDEKPARWREAIGGARPVGPLLFPDDEQEIDALLTGAREVVGGDEHRGGDSLGIAGAAPAQPRSVESRRDVRGYGVEMRRESDAATGAERPDVGATAGYLLDVHVPSAGDEPF